MGNNISCCSTEEIIRNDDDTIIKPIIYTCPDEYFDEINIHRSASELTRIPIEDIQN